MMDMPGFMRMLFGCRMLRPKAHHNVALGGCWAAGCSQYHGSSDHRRSALSAQAKLAKPGQKQGPESSSAGLEVRSPSQGFDWNNLQRPNAGDLEENLHAPSSGWNNPQRSKSASHLGKTLRPRFHWSAGSVSGFAAGEKSRHPKSGWTNRPGPTPAGLLAESHAPRSGRTHHPGSSYAAGRVDSPAPVAGWSEHWRSNSQGASEALQTPNSDWSEPQKSSCEDCPATISRQGFGWTYLQSSRSEGALEKSHVGRFHWSASRSLNSAIHLAKSVELPPSYLPTAGAANFWVNSSFPSGSLHRQRISSWGCLARPMCQIPCLDPTTLWRSNYEVPPNFPCGDCQCLQKIPCSKTLTQSRRENKHRKIQKTNIHKEKTT